MSRFLRRGPKADAEGRRQSVYEDPERFGARLRRWFSREPDAPRPVVNEFGNPVFIVGGGEILGLQAEDGSTIPLPSCCEDPARCRREECWTRIGP